MLIIKLENFMIRTVDWLVDFTCQAYLKFILVMPHGLNLYTAVQRKQQYFFIHMKKFPTY